MSTLNIIQTDWIESNLVSIYNSMNTLDKIAKGIPSWKPSELPKSASVPIYDKSFLTLFANGPGILVDSMGVENRYPVKNFNESFRFYVNDEDTDGFVFAMTSCWINWGGGITAIPGMITPYITGDQKNSRMRYNNNSFNPCGLVTQASVHAHSAYEDTPGHVTFITHAPHGYKSVAFNSIEGKLQTIRDSLDFIFHISDTGPNASSERPFKRRGRRKS
jgi:hypothetical protein